MEVPFMPHRGYHSTPTHFEEDDILDSSSYSLPISTASGSTIIFEPSAQSGRSAAATAGSVFGLGSVAGAVAAVGGGIASATASPAAPRQRVRDMVKMFEGSAPSATSTPVHRPDSTLVHASSKPYYTGANRGNAINNFGDSPAGVKQYVTQFQEGDEPPVKINDRGRRNTGLGRGGCHLANQCFQQHYPEIEEHQHHQQQQQQQLLQQQQQQMQQQQQQQLQQQQQQLQQQQQMKQQEQLQQQQQQQQQLQQQQMKFNEKYRRYPGSGCSFLPVYGTLQSNPKPFVQQSPDAGEPIKVPERCQRCNVLRRNDEVHYCLAVKKDCGAASARLVRSELDCNNGNNKPNNGLKLGPYSGFAENRNIEMLRFPSKEISESKAREPHRNGTDLFEGLDGIPVTLAYDSKTTILRTEDGVRIVVDISIDSTSTLSAADVICSRVETEMPHSRILTEFQRKSAMIMAGEDARM